MDDSVLFDTDIFIWVQRGHPKAAALIDRAEVRCLSVQTYLELLQGAQNRDQQRLAKQFLADLDFTLLPLTETIGHRAMVYIEEYGLATGLRAGDARIAATAAEHALQLVTSNAKHFKSIRGLRVKPFRP